MKKNDLISSLAWLIVGVLFCTGSIRLGLGTISEPGPGFFPFLMSAFLISFSLIKIISSLKKGGEVPIDTSKGYWPERDGIKRIAFVFILLFMFTIALNYLGFVLTTFLFIFSLLRFVDPQKWQTVFLTTVLTTVLSYAIFEIWLKANLPEGLLGF